MSVKNDRFIEIMAGGFGGVCSVLAGHSLDTVKVCYNEIFNNYLFNLSNTKVRLQTMPHTELNFEFYKTTFSYFRKMVKNEVTINSLVKKMLFSLTSFDMKKFNLGIFGVI